MFVLAHFIKTCFWNYSLFFMDLQGNAGDESAHKDSEKIGKGVSEMGGNEKGAPNGQVRRRFFFFFRIAINGCLVFAALNA